MRKIGKIEGIEMNEERVLRFWSSTPFYVLFASIGITEEINNIIHSFIRTLNNV